MAGPLVLIVDDEDDILQLLSTFLKGQGCGVVTATDSYSAVAKLREAKPQLILLDFQLPAGSGANVLRTVRNLEIGAALPVIFISAFPIYQIEAEAALDDKCRYLPKPLDLPGLLKTMEELLGPWREPPPAAAPAQAAPPPAPKPPADPDDPDNPPSSGTVLDLDKEP